MAKKKRGEKEMIDKNPDGSHQKVIRLVGKGKNVLEVGCGAGFVSEQLERNSCIVTGIEVDRKKAVQAEKFCESVWVADVEKMKFEFAEGGFDVILFGDILEHLLNPKVVLEKLKPFLANDGRIVVSLPNITNWKIRLGLLFGRFDYADQGILDRTHIRFFTRKNGKRLIEEAGFRVVKEEFVPSFPFPFFKRRLAKVSPEAFAFQFVYVAKKEAAW